MSGQGPQWWGMGRELMQQEPVFRRVIECIVNGLISVRIIRILAAKP
jgi:acyl transferase domain-containing protein